MSLIGISKVNDSQDIYIKQSIMKSLDSINYKFNRKIKNILIKPNLCYYWGYSTGETTNPKVVSAIIDILREKISPDVNISIVESDASAMECKYAFKMLGYEDLSKIKKVKLVNLNECEKKEYIFTTNNTPIKLYIPEIFKSSDLFINIPKFKYIPYMDFKISCALKNIFGCIAYKQKHIYHDNLEEIIVKINDIIKTDLCIVDSIYYGSIVYGLKTFKLGLIMSSIDPVAIDAAACRLFGIDPVTVKQIALSSKNNIGNIEYIEKGDKIKYFMERFSDMNKKLSLSRIQRVAKFINNTTNYFIDAI